MKRLALLGALGCALAAPVAAQTHSVTIDPVELDRWMYPFNGTPGTRNLAPTFGAVGSAPDFDNKDGQLVVAADTAAAGIPTGQGPSSYTNVTVRVYATHFQGVMDYDPTYDTWQTYLDAGDPSHVPDADPGRPLELYGVGFRNGYTSLTTGVGAAGAPEFEENEAFCGGCAFTDVAARNVFPFDFGVPDPEGDVSNNVVRSAPLAGTGFDPIPWAIGLSTSGLAPGDPVPEGSFGTSAGETFEFTVDTSDPDILAYVQEGLDAGVLAFNIVSMHETAQMAGGSNPDFYMAETTDAAAIPPSMDVDVTVLPEPGAAALAAGVATLVLLGRRRERSA